MIEVNPGVVLDYMESLKKEFPKLKIHTKKSWWLKKVFSLPGIKKLKWENSTQTIGMNIWLSDQWESIPPVYQLSTLRHERKHLLWFRNHTTILASLLYLFFIFPIGLAYYRALFERDGYRESMVVRVQCFGPSQVVKKQCRKMYERTFLSWKYFKMWPFRKTVARWFSEDFQKAVDMYKHQK